MKTNRATFAGTLVISLVLAFQNCSGGYSAARNVKGLTLLGSVDPESSEGPGVPLANSLNTIVSKLKTIRDHLRDASGVPAARQAALQSLVAQISASIVAIEAQQSLMRNSNALPEIASAYQLALSKLGEATAALNSFDFASLGDAVSEDDLDIISDLREEYEELAGEPTSIPENTATPDPSPSGTPMSGSMSPTPNPTPQPVTFANRWTNKNATGLPDDRQGAVPVWTGSKVIYWGGMNAAGSLNTGFVYDPATNAFRTMSVQGAPSPRDGQLAFWTGTRMLVYGGRVYVPGLGDTYLSDGGFYDPTTDTWSPMTMPSGLGLRSNMAVHRVGTKTIVYGGMAGTNCVYDGAIFDDATSAWTPIPSGGQYGKGAGTVLHNGKLFAFYWTNPGVFDFATGQWSPIAQIPQSEGLDCRGAATSAGDRILLRKKYYDPATNTYGDLETSGAALGLFFGILRNALPDGRIHTMVLSNSTDSNALIYNPATHQTTNLGITANSSDLGGFFPLVWTGSSYLRIGGSFNGQRTTDLFEYR